MGPAARAQRQAKQLRSEIIVQAGGIVCVYVVARGQQAKRMAGGLRQKKGEERGKGKYTRRGRSAGWPLLRRERCAKGSCSTAQRARPGVAGRSCRSQKGMERVQCLG